MGESDFELYSKRQQVVLAILPYISAPLSGVGSAVIIYVIVRGKRNAKIQTYERLMLGMSTLDFISSFGLVAFGHWAMPAGTDFVVGARGNEATCTVSYYLLNSLFGSMYYSAFLAIYFMLLVRFHWPKPRIATWIEPCAHLFAVFAAVAFPIYAAVRSVISPLYVLPGFCWTANNPPGCTVEESPDCVISTAGSAVAQGTVLALFCVILVCMGCIVSQVRKTDEYLQQHTVGENSLPSKNKEIAKEALLYITAFFVVFFPLIPFFWADEKPESTSGNRRYFFAFAFLAKLLTPLQGLFNAIIYLRGRLLALNQEADGGNMTLGMFVAYLNATEEHSEQAMDPDCPSGDLQRGSIDNRNLSQMES